jgi:hypothetical protein
MVTPQVTHKFLQDAIRSLRFDGIMNICGIVFLHDLEVRSCKLREIDRKDPAKLVALYGYKNKRAEVVRPLQITKTFERETFPWGPAPSWQRIQELLKTECSTFMRTWEFNPEVESSPYQKLFKVFTRDVWLSIGSHIIDANKLPNPRSLEEAMRAWTPHAIETTLGKDQCHFLPSAHGLAGKYPKNIQSKSFVQMRHIFFPGLDVDIRTDSIWSAYTHPGAYINIYHHYLTNLEDDDIMRLTDYLDQIFSNLQCLPASKSPDTRGTKIWSTVKGKIQFVTNSSFYRIQEVGGRINDNGAPIRPQTSSRQLEERIRNVHGGSKVSKPRVRPKSFKTRNKRNPPHDKKKKGYKR